MAHQEGQDDEHLGDNWFSSFEQECLGDMENSDANMEETVQRENDIAMQKLFLQFQNSATAIAQLYKDRTNGLSLWVPFQNAASSVTSLYKGKTGTAGIHVIRNFLTYGFGIYMTGIIQKGAFGHFQKVLILTGNHVPDVVVGSVDTANHCTELGVQKGRQRHIRDIVSWVKKRRRHIRREELLAFLCGKNPPQRTKMSGGVMRHTQSTRMERPFPRFPSADSLQTNPDANLECFREAIALQGLDGAMSNISVGRSRPHTTPTPTQLSNLQRSNIDDLNSFLLEEFSRNCDSRKRSATPDVTMDSPTRKKNRLF